MTMTQGRQVAWGSAWRATLLGLAVYLFLLLICHVNLTSGQRCDLWERRCPDGTCSVNSECHRWCIGFKCDNGQCIDLDKHCDGDIDCRDYSDEHNCINAAPYFKAAKTIAKGVIIAIVVVVVVLVLLIVTCLWCLCKKRSQPRSRHQQQQHPVPTQPQPHPGQQMYPGQQQPTYPYPQHPPPPGFMPQPGYPASYPTQQFPSPQPSAPYPTMPYPQQPYPGYPPSDPPPMYTS